MKKLFQLTLATLFLLAGCYHATTPSASSITESVTAPAPPSEKTPIPSPSPPRPSIKTKVAAISLESGNLYFKPKNITVKVHQPVVVNYTNKGNHIFTIDELGVNFPLHNAAGSFAFTPTKTGAFIFYCSVPGHRQAGQFGTITVTE